MVHYSHKYVTCPADLHLWCFLSCKVRAFTVADPDIKAGNKLDRGWRWTTHRDRKTLSGASQYQITTRACASEGIHQLYQPNKSPPHFSFACRQRTAHQAWHVLQCWGRGNMTGDLWHEQRYRGQTVGDPARFTKSVIQLGRECRFLQTLEITRHHSQPQSYIIFTDGSAIRGCRSGWGLSHTSLERQVKREPWRMISQPAVW